jgi:hypothetical protein
MSRRIYKNRAAVDRAYGLRSGRIKPPEYWKLVKVLKGVRQLLFEEVQKSDLLWKAKPLENQEQKNEKFIFSFYGKIFQSLVCIECGLYFETLLWLNRTRCVSCQNTNRLSTHGHGYRERCTVYGVPFDNFGWRVVFVRDNWTCQICGVYTPESKRGTYDSDAPEVDHIWPLSLIRDGIKSPGHVLSNCRAACRECNQKLGAKGNQ